MTTLSLWVSGVSVIIGGVLAHRLYLMRTPLDGGERGGQLSPREWRLLIGSMVLVWVGLIAFIAQTLL